MSTETASFLWVYDPRSLSAIFIPSNSEAFSPCKPRGFVFIPKLYKLREYSLEYQLFSINLSSKLTSQINGSRQRKKGPATWNVNHHEQLYYHTMREQCKNKSLAAASQLRDFGKTCINFTLLKTI